MLAIHARIMPEKIMRGMYSNCFVTDSYRRTRVTQKQALIPLLITSPVSSDSQYRSIFLAMESL